MSGHKPVPGQLWRHTKSQHCYRIIDSSDDYLFAGDLQDEWDQTPNIDKPALRREIESLVGMILYRRMHRDFVRREADFLAKFTLIQEAEN